MTKYTFGEAIENILNCFNTNRFSFIISTEFGTVYVKQATEDFDQMNPVKVVQYSETRRSLEVPNVKGHVKVDYVAKIGNAHIESYAARVRVTEAMVKVMFLYVLDTIPSEDIIDAVVSLYLKDISMKKLTISEMMKQFMIMNVDMLYRNNDTFRMVIRKLISDRVNRCNQTTQEIEELIRNGGLDLMVYRFKAVHYMYFLGAIRYTLNKNPLRDPIINKVEFCRIFLSENN